MSDDGIFTSAIATVEDARRGIATVGDADRALKTIAVAEAAEALWERAKDTAKLFEAIKVKLLNQTAYAVWRQDVTSAGRPQKLSQVRDNLPDTDPGKDVIARWRVRLCKKTAPNKWDADESKIGAALADAHARSVRICEQQNMGTIRGTEGTGEFERYTPAIYVEKAREVLGAIDLDPATSDYAQETVRAEDYFTVNDDGLGREWHGRVWLNPPYHRDLAPKFIAKLIEEIEADRVGEAIVLTNNSTDTEWFRTAAKECAAICFTTGRIRFEVPNAEPVMPTQGQAFFYFGSNVKKFASVFKAVGLCVRPM